MVVPHKSPTGPHPSHCKSPPGGCVERWHSGTHPVASSCPSTQPHWQAASVSPHSGGLMHRPRWGLQHAGGQRGLKSWSVGPSF